VGGPLFSFFSQPQINIYNTLKVPKKFLLYSNMGTRPWKAQHEEVLRWYDYWLKGIDTGIMDEPPVRYYTAVDNKWSKANEWPIESTVWTKFYLNSLESLSPEPDNYNDVPDCFVQQPLYVSEERARVRYMTPPLAEDVQVTGPPRITFYAAIDADDTNFRIDVRDEPSDNSGILPLSSGWLKASFRALDKKKTTPWEIGHDFTKSVPVKPGEINEYVAQLRPISYTFKAGHRIKLEISSIDIPTDPETYDVMWHVCSSRPTLHKIYRDGKYPSHLLLPVIPRD
jgi:predicted acyl esterase